MFRSALLPSWPATAVWLCRCLTFGALLSSALAYPSGAPDSRCNSMLPNHYGAVNHNPAAVYTLTASSSTYSSEQLINVTIASVNGEDFRGFLLQARPADDTDSYTTVGTFQSDSSTKLVCNEGGLTHNSRLYRSSITVTWKAPDELQGGIKFRATVVKVKLEVYPELYSDVVSQSTATTSPSTSTTTTIIPTTTATTASTSAITSSTPTTFTTSPAPSTTPSMSTSSTATSPPSSSTTASLTSPVSSAVPPISTTEAETNTGPVDGAGPERCNILACLLLPLLPRLLSSLML